MLRNYFITAFRGLVRNKIHTLINVLGLALGITCCLLIFLVVKHETAFDTFHSRTDNIYRITNDYKYPDFVMHTGNTAYALTKAFRTDFPQIEANKGIITQVHYSNKGKITVNGEQPRRFNEEKIFVGDEYFFKVFDFAHYHPEGGKPFWISGNPEMALSAPYAVVLTESTANKYFQTNRATVHTALGKTINLDGKFDLKVTGIIKDLPANTHLPFSMLISFATLKAMPEFRPMLDNWGFVGGGSTYVLLPENTNVPDLESQLKAFADKYANKTWGKDVVSFGLQPLKEIHFDQRFADSNITPTRNKASIWTIALIGALIIITACINFVNLATAQATKRAKEVGVRKVLGAQRKQLIGQFMSEIVLITVLAIIIAVGVSVLFIPQVNHLLEVKVALNFFYNPEFALFLLGLLLFISMFAGFYPSFIMSGFRPVLALKAKLSVNRTKTLSLRRALVITQFVITQILIIGTIVIASQMEYFRNKELGYNQDAVLLLNFPRNMDNSKLAVLRNQLLQHPGVRHVSYAGAAPTSTDRHSSPLHSIDAPGEEGYNTENIAVDAHFLDTYGMKLIAGKGFSDSKNGQEGYVVNEVLVQRLGFKSAGEAIGKRISIGKEAPIIGVVSNFHSRSLHNEIKPLILHYSANEFTVASVKIGLQDIAGTIGYLQQSWSENFPDEVFDYAFLNERIASLYKAEDKVYTVFKLFSFIAIFIGCLGLYGLVSFMAIQRTKEIGVRKVLGASVSSIVYLFSKEFFFLIVLAFFIAAPVAYYVMSQWLQDFAFRIELGVNIFLIAGLSSLLIAALTVGYQSVKAALANPVKSLRNE